MNVLTYSCGQLRYSDHTSVLSKLNDFFKFDNVVSVESTINIERYGEKWKNDWKSGNLILIDYYDEVKNCCFRDTSVEDMAPLSKDLIEKLSLDKCLLYSMHRDETLTYRKLDEEIMRCLRYWNFILDNFNIELFICHGIAHAIYTYSLYALCKARDIKVLYLARSVNGYSYIHDDYFKNFEKLDKEYKAALKQSKPLMFSEFMKTEFIEKNEKNAYVSPFIKKESGRGKKKIIDKRNIKPDNSSISFYIQDIMNKPKRFYKGYLERRAHKTIPKKTAEYYKKISCCADYSKRYIYVPLQVQPEVTTSPLGNIFGDVLSIVTILSHCTKDTDILLYVKEHPAQIRKFRRSRRELYDNLKLLPNVKLIDMHEDTYKLQDNCIASATLTGSVVMESLFRYKPVLAFGNHIHLQAPHCFRVSDVDSCKAALNEILEGRFTYGKKERDAFLYAIEKACFRAFFFSQFADMFGQTQDESAENTYLAYRDEISNWLKSTI